MGAMPFGQPPIGQQLLIINANDVVMLQLGEHLRLRSLVRRNLQRDKPLHGRLPCQEHGGEGPFAQRLEQIEVVDGLANLDLAGQVAGK